MAAYTQGSGRTFLASQMKCRQPATAAAYTRRCSRRQRAAPSRLIMPVVDVAVSGTSSVKASMPTVMYGRLTMSAPISRQSKK